MKQAQYIVKLVKGASRGAYLDIARAAAGQRSISLRLLHTLSRMGLLGGVSATQIDGNTVSVTAHGNGYTTASTIKNYALLKAADETVALGFDYFALGDESDESRHGAMSFSSGSASYHSWFGSGFSMEMIKPGETIMVKMYHGKKPDDSPPNYFDAHEVENYLGRSIKRQ